MVVKRLPFIIYYINTYLHNIKIILLMAKKTQASLQSMAIDFINDKNNN